MAKIDLSKKNPVRNFVCVVIAVLIYFAINLSSLGGDAIGPQGRIYIGGILMMLVIWLTNATSAPVSAFILMGVMCLTMPMFIPDATATTTYQAILSGYTQSTFPLLLSAFAISFAVNKTGLGKRLGIILLRFVGPSTKRLLVGILVGFPLVNLLIPSVQSTMLIFMAILAGIVEDYNIDPRSNVAKSMYLTLCFAALPDTMYIQTAGAAAIRCSNIIQDVFGSGFTYIQYMVNGLPLPIILGLFAYFFITKCFPAEFDEFPGGDAQIKARIAEFPKMNRGEKTTAVVLAAALFMWVTGGILHNVETGTVALVAAMILFLPYVGVMSFPEAMPKMNWGILIMVGCTSSIATGLVKSGAAKWIANTIVENTPVASLPLPVILVGGMIVVSIVAFGFATRASVVTATLPILAAFAVTVAEVKGGTFNPMGMANMLFYPMIFSAILPVHSPFLLQCAGSNTFEEGEFTKVAIPYVVVGIATCILCFFTYWRWIGLA